jgi:hypothetical protein
MIENGRMRLNQLTENSPVLPHQRVYVKRGIWHSRLSLRQISKKSQIE